MGGWFGADTSTPFRRFAYGFPTPRHWLALPAAATSQLLPHPLPSCCHIPSPYLVGKDHAGVAHEGRQVGGLAACGGSGAQLSCLRGHAASPSAGGQRLPPGTQRLQLHVARPRSRRHSAHQPGIPGAAPSDCAPGAAATSTTCSPSWGASAMQGRNDDAPCRHSGRQGGGAGEVGGVPRGQAPWQHRGGCPEAATSAGQA